MAKKVLVVDDEQDIVETLKFMIEMLHFPLIL